MKAMDPLLRLNGPFQRYGDHMAVDNWHLIMSDQPMFLTGSG